MQYPGWVYEGCARYLWAARVRFQLRRQIKSTLSVSGRNWIKSSSLIPAYLRMKKNHLPSLTPRGPRGLPPDASARSTPHRAPLSGAAPNRADSQGADRPDGEASDEITLRGVRARQHLTPKIAGAKRQKAGHQAISLDCARSRAAPARPRVHGLILDQAPKSPA